MASISLHQLTKTYGSGKQALQVLHLAYTQHLLILHMERMVLV